MVISEIKSSFLIIDFSSAEKKCGNHNVPGHSDKERNNENRKKRGFVTANSMKKVYYANKKCQPRTVCTQRKCSYVFLHI